jgi:hypothetical protein
MAERPSQAKWLSAKVVRRFQPETKRQLLSTRMNSQLVTEQPSVPSKKTAAPR